MPHPILKRARSDGDALLDVVQDNSDTDPAVPVPFPYYAHLALAVHFPPSPSLTRTFSAHSPTQYDRSPIVVSPNQCALPARGCPGRTYYDSSPKCRKQGPPPRSRSGTVRGHLHPRALAYNDEDDEEEEGAGDEDEEAERTPTRTSPYIPLPVQPPIPNAPSSSHRNPYYPHPQQSMYPSYLPPAPALVPDLSSSDESDGFISPPPEPTGFPPSASLFSGGAKYPTYGGNPNPYAAHPFLPPAAPSVPSSAYSYPYPPPPSNSTSSAYPYPYPSAAPTSPRTSFAPAPPSGGGASPPVPRRSGSSRSATPGPHRSPRLPNDEEEGYEEDDDHDHGYGARLRPPRPRSRSRSRERASSRSSRGERSPRSSSDLSTSPSDKSRKSSSSSSSSPAEKKERKERKEKKEKDRDNKRVSKLCRVFASGASFRDADGDGCLGGF